nr:beta-lactamase family protein [Gemmatimonadaceae bacterium]
LPLSAFLAHTHHLDDRAVVMSAAFTGAVPERDWPTLLRLATPARTADLVYSNFGYNVAAMVIDRVRPEGWRRVLETEVQDAAGLRDTWTALSRVDGTRLARPHRRLVNGGWATDPFAKTDATMNSAGGHVATLDDLARWTIVQMDSGRIDGRQVYPATAVALGQRLIARQTREASRRFAFFDRDGWGAGWDLGSYRGEHMVSRFGGYASIRSHLSFLPARRVGVVAMSTGGSGGTLTDIVAAMVYDLEAGRGDARAIADARVDSLIARQSALRSAVARDDSAQLARRHRLTPAARAALAGRYSADGFGSATIAVRTAQLRLRWGLVEGELLPSDSDAARYDVSLGGTDFVLRVDTDSAGSPRAIVINGVRLARR